MQLRFHNVHKSTSHVASLTTFPVRLGRSSTADVLLDSPFVSDSAAMIHRTPEGFRLIVENENGCRVDGRHLEQGRSVILSEEQKIELFPFEFRLKRLADEAPEEESIEDRKNHLVRETHRILLDKMNLAERRDSRLTTERVIEIESNVGSISTDLGLTVGGPDEVVRSLAADCIRHELLSRAMNDGLSAELTAEESTAVWRHFQTANQARERELTFVVRRLAERMHLTDDTRASHGVRIIEDGFSEEWRQLQTALREQLRFYLARRRVIKLIKDSLFGYGPLEDLLRLPGISEIMVLGNDTIFVERNGVLENSGQRFPDHKTTLLVINRIVSRVGRRVDRSQPIVDARLADGSRVNAVLPPVALDGPLLTIRRFPSEQLTIDKLIHQTNSLTEDAAAFLKACIRGRKNIIISGGTGTGKTTLLNCLAGWIPDEERVITIEDTAELQTGKRHVARMETRSANIEGEGELGISDLVKNALRMRPDRIVVGECRGDEALWMLQAMNTGHSGCLTTVHANSARGALLRLDVLVQSGSNLPVDSIHRQISTAIDLVVQLKRESDGSRVVSEVTEVLPATTESPDVRTRTIFQRTQKNAMSATGHLPTFAESLMNKGLMELDTLFPRVPSVEESENDA